MITFKYLLLLLVIQCARGIFHSEIKNIPQGFRLNNLRSFPGRYGADEASFRAILKRAFVKDEIVPYCITSAPPAFLFVEYPGGEVVDLGNELLTSQTLQAPAVHWNAPSKSLYTLIMLDLDSKSPVHDNTEPHLHWLVTNIPRNKLHHGAVLAQYAGPKPVLGSGVHRYVFFLYLQKKREPFMEFWTDTKNSDFDLDEFTDTYSLGQPVAGNYFKASYYTP